ncbi:MAG: lysine--tRNA ligase [Deltaproteobacteria bacterium]|nr:lysine--tRNA ligase [Deltaproteobacteria bacterium]
MLDPRRTQKIADLRAAGIEPWPPVRPVPHTTADCRAAGEGIGAPGADRYTLAGRVMAQNEMGKAGFFILQDHGGRLQVYVRQDDVDAQAWDLWTRLDLGDIVRVEGVLMRTRRGDLTLAARSLHLAAKCVRSLPDKWKGLADVEFRHRHRYVDLFMDPDVRRVFQVRARVVGGIRRFFDERGFVEVETPMMQVIPGGATARPFVTHHNALGIDLYLRVAPELFLKRLVVGGLERVYELNRSFRNEGVDLRHNPEFTMLEFYQAHASYRDLMDLTEELLCGLAEAVHGTLEIPWDGATLSFARPWRRATMAELLAEATGLAGDALTDPDALARAYLRVRPEATGEPMPATFGRLWDLLFGELVEPLLREPTFVTRFPVEISPLARRCDDDPRFVDRFELFAATWEIANGFAELNDPEDQAERFQEQVARRVGGDAEAMHYDADYVEALSYGMPPTAGEGVGVDRLVMLLTDRRSIREVILFPTLRPTRDPTTLQGGEPSGEPGIGPP